MKLIPFFFFLNILFMAPLINAESYHYSVDYTQCVRVSDNGYQSNGQRVIRFYNGCPSKLYINACVVDSKGNSKLYRSGSKISSNGNFTIFTFPDVDPKKVTMTAATSDPGIPAFCKADAT